MSNKVADNYRLTYGSGEAQKPGWYLEKQKPGGNELESVRGPGTIANVRDQLRKELGPGNEVKISDLLEEGVRKDVQKAAKTHEERSTAESLTALNNARERATEARTEFPENLREAHTIELDSSGKPVGATPPGLVIEDTVGCVKIAADRSIDIRCDTDDKTEQVAIEFRSDYPGDVIVTGSGDAKAVRDGEGPGDAVRTGSGPGGAERYGGGDGSAMRDGAGDGYATRDGAGHGGAIRSGTGAGDAIREGRGRGDAIVDTTAEGHATVREQSSGSAVRAGGGAGNAQVEDNATGNAVRTGTGHGNAKVEHKARGHAIVDESAPGIARNDSEATGDAINRSSADGDAVRGEQGNGNAVRQGTGAGDAIRQGAGDGHAWRAGAGIGNAVSDTTGAGTAVRTGRGEGKATRNVDGVSIECTLNTRTPAPIREELQKLGAEHGIHVNTQEAKYPIKAPPRAGGNASTDSPDQARDQQSR